MRKYYIEFIFSALIAAGCSSLESPEQIQECQDLVVTATFAEDTKSTLKDGTGKVLWEPGDEIKVFYGSEGSKFTSTLTENSASSDFKGTVNYIFGLSEGESGSKCLWAVYPYSDEVTSDGASVTVAVPSVQSAREGSFAKGANVCVARSNTLTLGFYNVCGGLRFSLTQEGIRKVVFESLGSESISGKAQVAFEEGAPLVKEVTDGVSYVSLTAPDNGTFKTGVWYYFTAIPGTLESGFKMSFYTQSQCAVRTYSKSVSFKRGVFGSVTEIDKNLVFEDIMEPIDLGLSVQWAPFNLGAAAPEDYGDYYAWGETETKSDYSWSTYKWCNGSYKSMTKYCVDSSYGTVDNKTVLEADDDVAHVKLGGSWRMPTDDEWTELEKNCTWTWTTLGGVYGRLVTSKKEGYTDKSIFLPAAGYRSYTYLSKVGSHGYYWSSSLGTNLSYSALYELFFSGSSFYPTSRENGLSVRPVYGDFISATEVTLNKTEISVKEGSYSQLIATVLPENSSSKQGRWVSSDKDVATVSTEGIVIGVSSGTCTVTVYAESGVKASCSVTVTDGPDLMEAVDLGLSVKWASCNVGATRPEDLGASFAWGETETKSDYDEDTYKWFNGSYKSITKYCVDSSYGTVDNKTVLEPDDDVAHVKWGGSWRMPTDDEWTELEKNCTWTWTTLGGVYGRLVTSKKEGYTDKSIFLPAAGYRSYTYLSKVGSHGYYWSSSLNTNLSYIACYELFYSGSSYYPAGREDGLSVRPVYGDFISVTEVTLKKTEISVKEGSYSQLIATVLPENSSSKQVRWVSSDKDVATVSTEGVVTGVSAGTCTITAYAGNEAKATCSITVTGGPDPLMEPVDLGLSVKWASCNVGATSPEDFGASFAWGEAETKSDYWWDSYKYCNGSTTTMTKYCVDSRFGSVDNKTVLEADDDVAHVKWGGSWRMPTDAEWTELRNNCTWTWTTLGGVYGRLVTSKKEGYTDKSIFLPAAGYRGGTYLYDVGSIGLYWSSSLYSGYSADAWRVYFNSDYVYRSSDYRYLGLSVRPVTE